MSCPGNPEGPGDQQSWGSALPTPRCLICHMTLSKLFSISEPQLPPLGNSQLIGPLEEIFTRSGNRYSVPGTGHGTGTQC